MAEYHVYLRTDAHWAMRRFNAGSPRHAITLARRFADAHFPDLNFETYLPVDCPINEIGVFDEGGSELAVWYDDDVRLRLAAPALLAAAAKVVARWERGDLAEAVRDLNDAVMRAQGKPLEGSLVRSG
jgi:hypothetical protein